MFKVVFIVTLFFYTFSFTLAQTQRLAGCPDLDSNIKKCILVAIDRFVRLGDPQRDTSASPFATKDNQLRHFDINSVIKTCATALVNSESADAMVDPEAAVTDGSVMDNPTAKDNGSGPEERRTFGVGKGLLGRRTYKKYGRYGGYGGYGGYRAYGGAGGAGGAGAAGGHGRYVGAGSVCGMCGQAGGGPRPYIQPVGQSLGQSSSSASSSSLGGYYGHA